MSWRDDSDHPFAGIAEKLYRAKENIVNLNAEIEGFFNNTEYPAIPEHDNEIVQKALLYHQNLVIPPRFSVLAGETIHQLRSCFDHIVWHFSTGPKQNDMPVDFPVFTKKPTGKNELARFNGKIQRITNVDALSLIEGLQPYKAADPLNDPLFIIHHLDIIDKHQELLLCFNAGTRVFPQAMLPFIKSYEQAHPGVHPAQLAHYFKDYGVLQPCIAFREFGNRENEPVVLALMELFNYTAIAIDGFAAV